MKALGIIILTLVLLSLLLGGGFGIITGLVGGIVGLVTGLVGGAIGLVVGLFGAVIGVGCASAVILLPVAGIILIIAGLYHICRCH